MGDEEVFLDGLDVRDQRNGMIKHGAQGFPCRHDVRMLVHPSMEVQPTPQHLCAYRQTGVEGFVGQRPPRFGGVTAFIIPPGSGASVMVVLDQPRQDMNLRSGPSAMCNSVSGLSVITVGRAALKTAAYAREPCTNIWRPP